MARVTEVLPVILHFSILNLLYMCFVNDLPSLCQCLCLAPTYELALQIGQVTEQMAKHMTDVQIAYAVRGQKGKSPCTCNLVMRNNA